MELDTLPKSLEQAIVQQLGPRLLSLSSTDGGDPSEDFSLHESLLTWILDLPSEIPDNRPLESFRRRIEFWHHQIWQASEPRYFARSTVPPNPSFGDPLIKLCKVARSPLAAQIDSTLAWVDANTSLLDEPVGHNWRVRLLIASRFDFYGLALVESEEIRRVVTLSRSPGEVPRILSAGQFRQDLLGRRVVFGLR